MSEQKLKRICTRGVYNLGHRHVLMLSAQERWEVDGVRKSKGEAL